MASIAIENVLYSEAREANRLKDEFLTTPSHELRTPLTAILGWTRILRSPTLDRTRFAHGLDVIERNVNAQAKLIDDLLDISRISAAKLRLEHEADGGRSCRRRGVVEGLRPASEAKSLDVQVRIDPSAAGASDIAGTPTVCSRSSEPPLSNAIKSTPPGGSIEIGVERTGSQVKVRVSDTGRASARTSSRTSSIASGRRTAARRARTAARHRARDRAAPSSRCTAAPFPRPARGRVSARPSS